MVSGWISKTAAALLLAACFAAEPGHNYPRFTDVTAAAGLSRFVNKQGTARKDYIVESIGGGAAFFDYDKDGWLDILLVRGADLETYEKGGEPVCALYRNRGDGTFTDVTDAAGFRSRGWSMGVAVADYDGDGFDDFLITGYGRNFLFRNMGGRGFSEVAAKAGVLSEGLWSTGAAFFDYDRDGDLDLYVARYVRFDARAPIPRSANCKYQGLSVFCGPQGLQSEPHSLYRNQGDGTFVDVSARAGLRSWKGPAHGLGVISLDADNDGWPDLYVGNDSSPNMLWRNLGDGRLVNTALEAGVAFSADGMEQASMGVEAGDLQNRGLLELYVTNFSGETNELYRNRGEGFFEDVTWEAGLGHPTLEYLGWSTHMADLDHDGRLDILVVNGHVYPEVDTKPVGSSYRQKLQVFRNLENGKFESVGERMGVAFQASYPGRGAALGDFDNDGDLDILINNIDAAPTLLRHEGRPGGKWLQVELEGKGRNRNAIGARVFVRAGGVNQMREINSQSGYLSSSSRRAHFGLGSAPHGEVVVRWPDGREQLFRAVEANQLLRVREP